MPAQSQAILFYASAKGFFQFVQLGQLIPPRDEAQSLMFLPPKSMLIGFAVEFYFKAWLSHAGASAETLRGRAYGHNLHRLFEEACKSGLMPRNEYKALVNQFGPQHADLSWRYMKSGGQYPVSNFDYALQLLDQLDDDVDAFVGASASKGLEPGRKEPP